MAKLLTPLAMSTAVQVAVLGAAILATIYPSAVQTGRLAVVAPIERNVRSIENSATPAHRKAEFGNVLPSVDAKALADWVARVDDTRGAAFFVVDKKAAHLYAFNGQAQLQADSPVLLGAALGDTSVPGIGERPIEQVRLHERTTPAGRFVAERGRNARGEDVVWVDYDAAVSMHRVVTANATERRLERLASPSAADNRISYGCINVPVAFYESFVRPAFASHAGIVYVLPDQATVEQYFPVGTLMDPSVAAVTKALQ